MVSEIVSILAIIAFSSNNLHYNNQPGSIPTALKQCGKRETVRQPEQFVIPAVPQMPAL